MEKNANSDAQLTFHNTSIRNLEIQLGQILLALNTHPKGALPSDTVMNPNGGNNTGHAMAVTTRSEKCGDETTSNQRRIVDDDVVVQEDEIPSNVVQSNDEVRIDIDENLEETQEEGLSINVPLFEALEQTPGYAKFMKDLVTKNRSMNCETIKMTYQGSAIVHSVAPKLKDPGAFTIPCTIGNADFAKEGIGQPRPIFMRLQMEDRTMKRPLVIIDDVLVRVDKFILPADFVILDCEVDYDVSIILGRPFLATGKALVDVEAGEITFRVGDENVVFHVYKSMSDQSNCDDASAVMNVEDTLEAVLLNHDDDEKKALWNVSILCKE
ncbi:uncharacterized protein [Nicotiana tomentosiformis]|uniref:uncharacterized protein n=1 Tax=Nicotiana tomentosiformis TaxID=4098 RepID=UPI00388CD697